MRRKPLAAIAFTALLLLVAASCSRAGGPSTKASPAKDELVVGTPADTFRTEGDRANLGMFPVNSNIFETLVRMTPDFQVEKGLAESWEYLGNNSWRFHLRKGVKFHDGKPLDAAAVKASLDRFTRAGSGSTRLGADSVKAVDDSTVDITPTAPNLRLVDQLVHPNTGIVAPGSDVGSKPTGTGPFIFVEYVRSERLVVERNDDYWGDKPKLKRIVFRFIPDDNTRWLALKTGEIDLMYDLPRELLAEAGKTEGVKVALAPPGASEIMLLNRTGSGEFTILQDPAVRKAIGMAIDRKLLVDKVWTGSATVSSTMTPTALFGTSASVVKGPAFDLAQAKAVLDQAGWKAGADGIRARDGRRLSLTMVNGYPPISLRKPMPEFVQDQLKAAGIEVKIVETPELATYSSRLNAGEGDILLERVAQNDANPAFFAASFFYSKAAGDYPKWFSAGPAFDAAVEASLASPSREEATRKAAEAMHVAVDEEAVVLPVAGVYWLWAMKAQVKGFQLHGSARHVRWSTVSFG